MRLLPDLRLASNLILSIQDPYTINGQLIMDMFIEESCSSYSYNLYPDIDVKFITADGDRYAMNKMRLRDEYNRLMTRNRGFRFYDEDGNESIFETFETYLSNIREQIYRYSSDLSGSRYARDKHRLQAQGREQYTTITSDRYSNGGLSYSTTVASDHYDASDYVTATTTDGRTIRIRTNDSTSFTVDNATINQSLWSELRSTISTTPYSRNTNEESFIHAYNYKPEYIKHRLENEECTLLLGAEIEVAGNTDYTINKNEVVKKCIQIMNGSDSTSEDLIYSTSDSTVQIELDTMPCSLEYHKIMNYKEMFKYLDEKGYKGHDCENAGLHIHADRSYLGKSELKQQLVISKILYILEKFNDEICVIARRNNSYSTFVGKEEVNKSLVKLYNKYENTGKRVALNLQHKDTIEFRCFKSTLKYETFILTLEFVQDIINYAKSINIEDIELIQWNDLMDTFSDDLKTYYKERKKKEAKKAAITKEDVSDNRSTQVAYGRGTRAAILSDARTWNGYADCLSNAATSISFSAEEAADNLNNWRTQLLGIFNNPTEGSIEFINSNNNEESVETKESLEKKIKDIKKDLRLVTNYMQKKKLQKELCDLRTELKKLKKKERNNSHNTNNESTNEVSTPNETRVTISYDLNNALNNALNNTIYAVEDNTLTVTDQCTYINTSPISYVTSGTSNYASY